MFRALLVTFVVASTSSAQTIYTADYLGANLSGFRVGAAGSLSAIAGSPFANTLGLAANLSVNPGATFAYAVGVYTPDIEVHAIDPGSGALLNPGTLYVGAGSFTGTLVFHPSGRFAYVLGSQSVLSVDPSAGTLTAVTGSIMPTGTGLGMDPDGQFLYVLQFSGQIAVYRIASETGILTEVSGSPFQTGVGFGVAFVLHPSGKYLYIFGDRATGASPVQAAVSVNPSTGVITMINQLSEGEFIEFPVITPSGTFLYAADPLTNQIYGFMIDPANGSIALLTSVPALFSLNDGASLASQVIMVDVSGSFLYAIAPQNNLLYGFAIGTSGQLTSLSGTYPTGIGPVWMAATTLPPGGLRFPIKQSSASCSGTCTPLTANVAAVFDHQQVNPYNKDHVVVDYRGEVGRCNLNGLNTLWSPVQVGEHGDGLLTGAWGYMQSDAAFFTVNGNYTGAGTTSAMTTEAVCQSGKPTGSADSRLFLFYDGHPGYDYPFVYGTPVFPAISGCVSYQIASSGNSTQAQFHTLAIIPMSVEPPNGTCPESVASDTGYDVFYLHLASYVGSDGKTIMTCKTPPSAKSSTCTEAVVCSNCPSEGSWVSLNATKPIGYVGNFANGDWNGVGAHLHFEIDQIQNQVETPIDPYGWYPIVPGQPDPYAKSHSELVNTWLWQQPAPY